MEMNSPTIERDRFTASGERVEGIDARDRHRRESSCPVYEEARRNPRWQRLLSGPVITTPKCGHLINRIVDKRRKWSNSTIRIYSHDGAEFIEFLHNQGTSCCNAEFSDVDHFFGKLSERILSSKTYVKYRTAINHIYKQIALSTDHSSELTSDRIIEWLDLEQLPTRDEIQREPLSEKEVSKLYSELDTFRNRLMAQVAIEWGARNESIRKIKIRHVDLDDRVVRLRNTKTGGTYKAAITEELTILLRHWLEVERRAHSPSPKNDFLFPSRKGGALSSNYFSKVIRMAAEDAGIQEVLATIELTENQKEAFNSEEKKFYRVTPHALRHTYNELLRDCGVPREIRSEGLDHSSTETTKRYYEHSSENHRKQIRDHFSRFSF